LPPVLTVLGEDDNIVTYSQATRLRAALEKAGVPNQLIIIPGRKHDGFNRDELLTGYATIRGFLKRNHIIRGE